SDTLRWVYGSMEYICCCFGICLMLLPSSRETHNLSNKSLKPGPRCTQLDCSTHHQLITSRSELQRATAGQIRQDLRCARDDASSQIHWVTQNTQSILSCRVEELKLWKSQTANSITQVDQEISLLEQVKASAETCLQKKTLYRQVLEECMMLRDGHLAGDVAHDHVQEQLTREVQLCEDIKQRVKQRITEALEHLRALKEMRSQLFADQKDKDDAINLNTQCLSSDLQSPSTGYRSQTSTIPKGTLTYEQWIAHSQILKKRAEELVLDSCDFHHNMQYSLSELINALEAQRIATDFSFRKRLGELSQVKADLEWEKQQVLAAVNELQAEMQEVEKHILCSGPEKQLPQTQLNISAQRLNYELCLDQPNTELQPETKSLGRNTFTLRKKLLLSQKTLDAMDRNLFNLENIVNEKTRLIGIDQKCQEIRERLCGLCRIPMD
ncbi:hypothetical protein NFI96_018983, partial [Prochilodus magdalenae]